MEERDDVARGVMVDADRPEAHVNLAITRAAERSHRGGDCPSGWRREPNK